MAVPIEVRLTAVRLIVHKPAGEKAVYAVVIRTGSHGQPRDQVLARGVIPCPPGSEASTNAVEALRLAVLDLTNRADQSPARRAAGAPQGLQGGLQLDLLTDGLP